MQVRFVYKQIQGSQTDGDIYGREVMYILEIAHCRFPSDPCKFMVSGTNVLNRLIKKGLLRMTGKGKKTIYEYVD